MINLDKEYEWDFGKELRNILKHGISFHEAVEVFLDPKHVTFVDKKHSQREDRFFAVGKVISGRVVTVRYTLRDHVVRIIGAADWRKWRRYYEQNTRSH